MDPTVKTETMTFRLSLLIILAIELLSFTFFWLPTAKMTALLAITLLVFIAGLFNLKYGVFAAIIELIIGSKGHLLAARFGEFNFSLRMGIFCAVILATIIYLLREKKINALKTISTRGWLIFSAILLWGAAFAIWRGNNLALIFQDFNAYLYFLYLIPFCLVFSEQKPINELRQIFSASVFSVCAKTLALLFVFSHYINFRETYKWVRDTGWGEIAIGENVIRVFSQSHIYALIGFVIFFFFLIDNRQPKNKKALFGLALISLTTVLISLSRSIWVGLAGSALCFLIYAIKQKWPFLKISKSCALFIALAFLSAGITWVLIAFPYPQKPLDFELNISNRFDLSEPAAATRWSELKPLTRAISNHPIIGSGFGTVVHFTNWDPRILEQLAKNDALEGELIDALATDNYATYAFEWGYLDIILKIGLFGLLVYLALIFDIAKKLFATHPELLIGLMALLFTHIFTPYINHPLGIGYIILLASIVNKKETPNF